MGPDAVIAECGPPGHVGDAHDEMADQYARQAGVGKDKRDGGAVGSEYGMCRESSTVPQRSSLRCGTPPFGIRPHVGLWVQGCDVKLCHGCCAPVPGLAVRACAP